MIKDKITQVLKSRFSSNILLTMRTGRERGFFICKDQHGDLFPGKSFHADVRGNRWYKIDPKSCPGGKIKGIFHTSTFIEELKDIIFEKSGYIPSTGEKRTMAESIVKKRYKNLNSPSYDETLNVIMAKCLGTDNDTICIGNDIETDKVECWTVKENIKEKDCNKALQKNLHRIRKGIYGKKEPETKTKWIIPLFDNEQITLK
jgi:hypothetical protein